MASSGSLRVPPPDHTLSRGVGGREGRANACAGARDLARGALKRFCPAGDLLHTPAALERGYRRFLARRRTAALESQGAIFIFFMFALLIFMIVLYNKMDAKRGGKGFPGGAVFGSLPANAGDTGSSPGLGGSHMLRSN